MMKVLKNFFKIISTFILLLSIFFIFQAHALSNSTNTILEIFNAEVECQKDTTGVFNRCKSVKRVIQTQPISYTNNFLIKSIRPDNTISYQFRCESSGLIEAGFSILKNKAVVVPLKTSEVKTYETAIPYGGAEYSFFVNPNPAVAVKPDCHFTLLSNITTPYLGSIKEYINQILYYSELKKEEINTIDVASTLPGKWIVIVELSGILRNKQKDESLRLNDLIKDIQTLQSNLQSGNSLTAYEERRLDELPELIREAELKIQDLKKLIETIKMALPETQQCILDDPINRSFCLSKLVEVKDFLRASLEQDKQVLEDIISFLDLEIKRLEDIENSIRLQLIEVSCNIWRDLDRNTPCPYSP
jgi:hypothetical protein